MKNVKAIKTYFDEPKVTTQELAALTPAERNELGAMCCEALGETHEPSKS